MTLICEVEDAPVIMAISKPVNLKSPWRAVKIANPLYVGIDVSSKNNVANLMTSDGGKALQLFRAEQTGRPKLLVGARLHAA